jgi:hypothetical protein
MAKRLSKKRANYLNGFLLSAIAAQQNETIDFDKLDIDKATAISLIYEIKMYENKTGEIIYGLNLSAFNWNILKTFLGIGGFVKIYNEERKENRKDNFRFWSIAVITFLTLLITIYQAYISCTATQSKNQTEKQSQIKQQSLIPDSTNPKKDTYHHQIH